MLDRGKNSGLFSLFVNGAESKFYDIDTWTLSSLTGMATKMAGSTSPSAWLCSTSGARVVSATSSAASVVTWTSSVAIIVVSETEDSVVSTTGGNVITLYFSSSLTLPLKS
jgi:hypothetical protein